MMRPNEDERRFDALFDEVTRRKNAVVDAAVEWYKSDEDWFDRAEELEKAIDSLLELKDKQEFPQMENENVAKPLWRQIVKRVVDESLYWLRLQVHCLSHLHRPYLTCFVSGDIERGCADCSFPKYDGVAV